MKRLVLFGLIIVVLGGGIFAYYQYGGSPEVRRERHLKKARDYLGESKFNEAIVEFRNAVKTNPRSAEARFELAMALLKTGDLRSAHGELVRAVELKPDFIKARYELGSLELVAKNLIRAKEQFEKLQTLDRDAFETRYLAAKIALVEKAPEKALVQLKEILRKTPNDAIIYLDLGIIQMAMRNFSAAEESLRQALELNPKISGARVALAQIYLATGKADKGETELIAATQADPENEMLLHVLGLYYSVTRRFDEIEKLYLGLLQKKPKSLIAKKRLAELYLSRGDLKNSQRFISEILTTNSGDIDGHFFRGRMNIIENNNQKAIEDLTIVTRDRPQFAPGFFFLALAQRSQNKIEDAKKNFAKAVELYPLWIPPRVSLAEIQAASGEVDSALEHAQLVLKFQPKNDRMLVVYGASLLRKKRIPQAVDAFQKAKQLNPGGFAAQMNLAMAYTMQKKYAEAIKEYKNVLDSNPERFEALNSIVRLYLLQNNSQAAIGIAEEHLKKTKNNAYVYQVMGQAKLAVRDYQEASKYLNRAVELNPNLASAYFLLGSVYSAQQKNDLAIIEYEKTIAKNPNTIPALIMIGMLYDRKQQPKKANEYYQRVLDINKTHILAANNLAYNYSQYGGNVDVALGIAQKAREANPDNPSLADTLGWIYYKKGSYLNAIALLKESNEKFNNGNSEVLYHLGMAYYKSGDRSSAAETLSKALASDKAFVGREEAKKILDEVKSNPR